MPSGVVGLYQGPYKRRPVPLLDLGHRAEHLQKGPVEPFCAAVATRMIVFTEASSQSEFMSLQLKLRP